jgi:hypothetical protein
VRIILPEEGNLIALEGQETVVSDGHAMGVAGEIAKHMMGSAEGWFGIDDSVLTEPGGQERAECFLVFEGLESSSKGNLVLPESAF